MSFEYLLGKTSCLIIQESLWQSQSHHLRFELLGLQFWIAPVTWGDPLDYLPHHINAVRPAFPVFAIAESLVPLSNFIMVQQ